MIRLSTRVASTTCADQDVEGERLGGRTARDEVQRRVDVRPGVQAEVQAREVVPVAAGEGADELEMHLGIPQVRDHFGPDRNRDVDDLQREPPARSSHGL